MPEGLLRVKAFPLLGLMAIVLQSSQVVMQQMICMAECIPHLLADATLEHYT